MQIWASSPWPPIAAAFGAGALIGLLVGTAQGRRSPPRPENDREKYLLEVQLRGKQEELRRASKRTDELAAFSVNFPQKVHELNAALNPEDLTNILSRACSTMLGTRSLQVLLLSSDQRELILAQCVEDGMELTEFKGKRIPADEAPQSWLLEQATVRDAASLSSHHPEFSDPALQFGEKRFPIALIAPLRTRQGTRGLVSLSSLPESDSRHPEETLGCLSQVAAMSLENLRSIDQARQEARLDLMTRLLNHASFKSTLANTLDRARPRGLPVAVFMFDLDNFKHYNDSNGHPAGDALLKALATLFRSLLRPVDVAARYGGEEFVAMLPGCTKPQALRIAERVRRGIETQSFPHGEKQPLGKITISGGVASYPEDNADPEDLVKSADVALYRAKKGGRNRVLAFENSMLAVNL